MNHLKIRQYTQLETDMDDLEMDNHASDKSHLQQKRSKMIKCMMVETDKHVEKRSDQYCMGCDIHIVHRGMGSDIHKLCTQGYGK